MGKMKTQRQSITSCAAFFAAALLARSPALADGDGPHVFAVTSQTDTAGQTVTTRELLAIGSQAGKPFVRISNGVATASFAAHVTSDGEIANDNADAGVICYNMATAVVAAHDKDPNAAVPLYIRFLDKIVEIPLTVNDQVADGTDTLAFQGQDTGQISNGKTAIASGLLIRGKIEETRGAIATAVFDEATVAGSPAERVSGTSCSLTEVPQSIGT
jgi:hypothetical protein